VESLTRWEDYSRAKDEMFVHTDIPESPWLFVESHDKRRARINMIAHPLEHPLPAGGAAAAGATAATAADRLRPPGAQPADRSGRPRGHDSLTAPNVVTATTPSGSATVS
jgi:hypothetical protein